MQDASSPTETAFIAWSEDLCIGIRRFDEEHERLAAFISHLYTTMILRRDKVLSRQIFERLILETRRHFDAEEALMQDLGYPDWQTHVAEHAQLLADAEELARNYDLGHISALALPAFLKKWLLHHIETSDRAYIEFFKANGVS